MGKIILTSLGLFLFSSSYALARIYPFPQTEVQINSETPLYTDPKTGGLIPRDRSFQFLAFEFEQTQPNNLMIRALKETWKKAGHNLEPEKDIKISGFWGQEIRSTQKIGKKLSYVRNLVFGDFNKVAQVSIICALKDPKEHCKGSDQLIKGIQWRYKPDQKLSPLSSKIKVPDEFKLYLRVNTKKGPVLMYTPFGEPMSSDSIPSLSFAINKGALNTEKFLRSFAKSSEMTGIQVKKSTLISKRTNDPILYSWGKRGKDNKNYYLSCASLDRKKQFQLMVCATGDQSNYQKIHNSLYYLSAQ